MNYKKTGLYKKLVFLYLKVQPIYKMVFSMVFCQLANKSDKNKAISIFCNYILKKNDLTLYKVQSHKLYSTFNGGSYTVIRAKRRGISPTIIYGPNESSQQLSVDMPDSFISELSNVYVFGNCDSILDRENKIIINDFLYDIDSKFSPSSQIVYGAYKNKALVRNFPVGHNTIKAGISIVADFSNNYYHLTHEVLVKLYRLQRMDIPQNIPILVDECIQRIPQFKQAFDSVFDGSRTIIWIPQNQFVSVEHLYYLSPTHVFPGQVKNIKDLRYEDNAFDAETLRSCKDLFLSYNLTPSVEKESPKRIFISRKGHERRSYNEDELFEVAKKYGFIKVLPETLSFAEQVNLFHNADVIIGASGAAFANLLFCHERAKAVIFFSMKVNSPTFTISSYLSNSKLYYLIGSMINSNSTPYAVHTDFFIEPNSLKDILDKIC